MTTTIRKDLPMPDQKPAKKAASKKVQPRKAVAKPTSQSPRYAGPVATGERKQGPKPEVHDDNVLEHDERRNLPGGIYLDRVQREEAEIQRAKIEGREPDLENLPLIQSTPARVKGKQS